MVDFDRMKDMALSRVLRGGYTAVGSVVSGATGNFLAARIDNDMAVDVAQVAVGAAASIGVSGFTGPDEALDEEGFVSEAVEFAGYGVQAAGWDALFEDLDIGITTGGQSQSERVVDVTARASESSQTDRNTEDRIAADVG